MRKIFAFLPLLCALCVLFDLRGSEVNIAPLLPSYTAMVVKFDIAALLKNPQLRQYLPVDTMIVRGVAAQDISLAAVGCDSKGKNPYAVLRFRDEAAWQKLWQALDGKLVPLPAERRIMLFRVNDPGLPPEAGRVHFAVLAPKVAAFYFRSKPDFRCDYQGVPEKLQSVFQSRLPLVAAGMPKIKNKAYRGIRFFSIAMVGDSFKSVVECRDKLTAALTMVAIQGSAAVWMQQYCALSPEEAAVRLQELKFRQRNGTLYISVSVKTVLELLQKMLVKF